jgi:hypothetical protein
MLVQCSATSGFVIVEMRCVPGVMTARTRMRRCIMNDQQ